MELPLLVVDDGRGIVYRLPDGCTLEEMLDLHRRAETYLSDALYILVDATALVKPATDSEGVKRIVESDLRLSRLFPGKVLAIAACGDLAFGMSRMYQALADHDDWKVQVFRSLEEAQAWIREILGPEGNDLTFA